MGGRADACVIRVPQGGARILVTLPPQFFGCESAQTRVLHFHGSCHGQERRKRAEPIFSMSTSYFQRNPENSTCDLGVRNPGER